MKKEVNFTTGEIVRPLLKFAFPVFLAMLLQSLYGAVDLLIVGRFAQATDVSAVSTGSQIMMTLTGLISSMAMGTTIMIGQMIGEGNQDKGGRILGSSICFFFTAGVVLTALIPFLTPQLATVMNAPEEAFSQTCDYIRVCGLGIIVIIAYNLIGSIFRGIGDSRTPLITVAIASVINILGDLLLIAGFGMGARGAALATVFAQLLSVVISFALIRRQTLPFVFHKKMLRFDRETIGRLLRLGSPIALQDLLVGISFLVLLAIVNGLGLIASAGVGVSEKVCGFIMLVPSAFMQAMAAFVAQNIGAGKYQRAKKALFSAIAVSTAAGIVMFYVAFFHGDLLAGIFTQQPDVLTAAVEYLKAYAIDCLFTCFLFCFLGFYNGIGYTAFAMVQGVVGAFCIRVPVSYWMSRQTPPSLFHIGLATPCSTVFEIAMCLVCLLIADRKFAKKEHADFSLPEH